LGKLPENTVKNGAQRCLILKNWRSTCAESHEDLFWEVISKDGVYDLCGRKYSHKGFPDNFSGKFEEYRAKIFRTPKTLPAPTHMLGDLRTEDAYSVI